MNTNKVVKTTEVNTNAPITFGGTFKAVMGYYAATALVQLLMLTAFGGTVYLIIKAFR